MGDQKLEGLSVRLENASHVKIDDYWTVGGEGNNTLEPFTSTEKTERYGELQNLAKVRVVSDGAGEITGDLIISADGQESVVIHLSGSAIQPVIRTQELTYAVKYVPYSYIISTRNMNEKVGVTYELWGKLPSGMYFDTKTGELYGVPTETGTYSFTVKANYSDPGFEPSTQTLELEVKDNEDETVFNATDEGYEIIPEENGESGYVGEQVSGYSFELDLENAEETFITSGDFAEFEKLWINGVELKAGTDFVAEPGSTIAHLFLDIIRKKPVLREGRNTISAQYKINESGGNSAGSSSGSSSSGRVYDSWRSNGGGRRIDYQTCRTEFLDRRQSLNGADCKQVLQDLQDQRKPAQGKNTDAEDQPQLYDFRRMGDYQSQGRQGNWLRQSDRGRQRQLHDRCEVGRRSDTEVQDPRHDPGQNDQAEQDEHEARCGQVRDTENYSVAFQC